MNRLSLFLILLLSTAADKVFSQASSIPEFTFYRLDGTKFRQGDVQNKSNSIFIFFDVTCSHCQKETEHIGNNYAKLKNAVFYMVSMDEIPAIKKFMASYGKLLNNKKNVTLLQDKDRQFIPRFMPTRYPAIFIYSPQGKLIKYFSGEIDIKEIIKAANS